MAHGSSWTDVPNVSKSYGIIKKNDNIFVLVFLSKIKKIKIALTFLILLVFSLIKITYLVS